MQKGTETESDTKNQTQEVTRHSTSEQTTTKQKDSSTQMPYKESEEITDEVHDRTLFQKPVDLSTIEVMNEILIG